MSDEIKSVELTKAQEDALAMELAKADFVKRVSDICGECLTFGIREAISQAFETGFKMGVAWRDET